jgi:mono/diheme cytochrome c family protein
MSRLLLGLLCAGLLWGCPKPSTEEPTGEPGAQALLPLSGANLEAGKDLYKTYCARCHGDTGKGDGPSAANFDVLPTDFTNPAKVTAKSDEEFSSWVRDGGAPKGKSALMPAFGRSLDAEQIRDVSAYAKAFSR